MNIIPDFKVIFAGLAAAISAAIGGIDMIVICLGGALILDFITGMAASAVMRTWSSSVGAKGIVKKICIILIVGVTMIIDEMAGASHVLRDAVCIFYLANEGISIIENLGRAGVPLPSFITKYFEKLKETAGTKEAEAGKSINGAAVGIKIELPEAAPVNANAEEDTDDAAAEADNAGDDVGENGE